MPDTRSFRRTHRKHFRMNSFCYSRTMADCVVSAGGMAITNSNRRSVSPPTSDQFAAPWLKSSARLAVLVMATGVHAGRGFRSAIYRRAMRQSVTVH